MNFRVQPEGIAGFADRLDQLKDDVAKAHEYLNTHLSYSYGDARMFATIADANEETKTAVQGNLEHLGKLLDASAGELQKAAQMYVDTDADEERRLDALYPRN